MRFALSAEEAGCPVMWFRRTYTAPPALFGRTQRCISSTASVLSCSAGFTYTGASLNIARTLGPVIAFQCHAGDAAWCARWHDSLRSGACPC